MRPDLRPKLRNPTATALRDRNCIQLDLDPAHSLLLTGDVSQIRDFLAALTGEHTVAQLCEQFEFAAAALFQLGQRGLLEAELLDSSITAALPAAQLDRLLINQRSHQSAATNLDFAVERINNLANSYIWIDTAGPASALAALLLAEQHVGRIKLAQAAAFKALDLPSWLKPVPDAETALLTSMQSVSANLKLTQPAGMPNPDLIIIADQPWLDPSEAASFLNRGIPHLVIDPLISEVAIGPLVLPGESGCLSCQEQKLTNIDRSWPIMRQLIGQHLRDQPDRLLLLTAVSFAIAQIIEAIGRGSFAQSALVGNRWRFKLPGPTIEILRCEPNMFCSCQWGAIAA